MTQSVQNSCNSLDTFKPVFKIGFFSLILTAAALKKEYSNSYDKKGAIKIKENKLINFYTILQML